MDPHSHRPHHSLLNPHTIFVLHLLLLHLHPPRFLLLLYPACDLCAYTCRRNDNLMLHRRTVHARERPFHCHLCDYRAAQVQWHIPLQWMRSAKNICEMSMCFRLACWWGNHICLVLWLFFLLCCVARNLLFAPADLHSSSFSDLFPSSVSHPLTFFSSLPSGPSFVCCPSTLSSAGAQSGDLSRHIRALHSGERQYGALQCARFCLFFFSVLFSS